MARANRYAQIIERIFLSRYVEGATAVDFERSDIERVAAELNIKLPKNLGDLIYSFRYRADLPDSITSRAPAGKQWIIRPAGRSKYRFVAATLTEISPNPGLAETKVPDATPGVISMYALTDEQALLAKVRYNRLIDLFTGVTCYALQSHLRTTVADVGQVETDELYVGVDRRGAHHIFPVQAKGGNDRLSVVQIEQDFALCAAKFRDLICRPVAAQFMAGDLIALFAFEQGDAGVSILDEAHYRLVPPDALTPAELRRYAARPAGP